jgi:hypothetical protein
MGVTGPVLVTPESISDHLILFLLAAERGICNDCLAL